MIIGEGKAGDRLWLLAAIAFAIPLILPSIPPLIDFYGHMARYHVLAELGSNPLLQRYYAAEWRPIGNLGVDLLVIPLSRLIGLQWATKLVIGAIPVLTALGILQLSRAVHGRISPLAVLALPLSFSAFFSYGFVNFCLGQALVLLVLAWWLRDVPSRQSWLRPIVLGLCALLVWLAHVSAWGALVIVLGAVELARLPTDKRTLTMAVLAAAKRLLPAAVPLLPMLLWPAPASDGPLADQFFEWQWKVGKLLGLLADPPGKVAVVTLLVFACFLVAALLAGASRRSGALLLAALLMWVAVALLPLRLMGSNLADVRLIPLALTLTLVAFDPTRHRAVLLGVAALFVAGRLVITTWHYRALDRAMAVHLPLLDRVPRGSAVLTLYGLHCDNPVPSGARLDHFGALVTVRRDAFTNNGFPGVGTPLQVRYPAAGRWIDIYHYQVLPERCLATYNPRNNPVPMTTEQALASFPRNAFSHVLLVRPVGTRRQAFAGLVPVASTGDIRLYRVQRAGQ